MAFIVLFLLRIGLEWTVLAPLPAAPRQPHSAKCLGPDPGGPMAASHSLFQGQLRRSPPQGEPAGKQYGTVEMRNAEYRELQHRDIIAFTCCNK